MKPGAKPIHHIMLFLSAIIWGSSFVVVKSSIEIVPPNMMIFIRFSLACVLLTLIFIPQLKYLRWSTLFHGAMCGLFLYTGYMFQTVGIVYTTPGKNAFLTAIYCVIVPFLFWATGKVKPDVYNLIAAFFCIFGIGFIALDGEGVGFINKGDLLTIVSGIAFSVHIVIVALAARDESPILITITQFATVAVCAGVASLFTKQLPPLELLNTKAFLELGYLVVFATALALLLQTIGQSRINPSTVSLIISLEAVFGVVFSIIFGYEVMNNKTAIGFALVFIAIIISETKLDFLKRIWSRRRIKENDLE